MSFDWFVLPFSLGLLILFILVVFKFSYWIRQLPTRDRLQFNRGIFSVKIFGVIGEIIMESLFHRRIFKINPLLGYMHMSFAFGWFMLIVMGNIETRIHSGTELNLPYYPIFFKFFLTEPLDMPLSREFTFIMDFFLLLVLSGVLLAFIKRIYSNVVGMNRTTKLKPFDVFAMLSLWLIFPLRLLAESMAAGMYDTGGFITQPLGNFLAGIMPLENVSYAMWWAYSVALGVFFVSVPYSRYMHIPTEILLISLRRFGIRRTKAYDIIKDVEVFSCSRCGICIDVCQLNTMAGIHNIQSAYFIKSVRKDIVKEEIAQNCLICGRCQQFCPVDIKTDDLRISQRMTFENKEKSDFGYLPQQSNRKADYLYFAGCMGHLTPGVIKSMHKILNFSGDDFIFLDQDGSICCGRPMMLSGNIADARKLMSYNKQQIWASGAHTLITSCPICLRIFKEDYQLQINVLHHTEYINNLMKSGRLTIRKEELKLVYHDPCELGRGLDIYHEPRSILEKAGNLVNIDSEKQSSFCCGGSLGNNLEYNPSKDKISKKVAEVFCSQKPDIIATSCPLCKKSLTKFSDCKVSDIAEIVASQLHLN